ncbi:hypothetical protein BU26DRAFT_552856 [Trematosphaeria pertusa]|uniref:DUF7924 domain-containing protein n=1 Tax=Trematosphaeria pertusa TaxID=390896 RepID=A0A6A6I5K1_9PLEO|nr:uncharacterized protein BU26DRAFT_552856 [Trematosphaeria pertusa]KAF2245814.1 hypothetical protein BU26DRAFT_552856 [Trematosphaeria pertusa]
MANNRGKLVSPKHRQKQTNPRDQGKRPQGVRKSEAQGPIRRSARLNPVPSDRSGQPHPAEKTLGQSTSPQPTGRKRSREAEPSPADAATGPSAKRLRTSADFAAARPTDRATQSSNTETPLDPIDYWRKEQAWPKEYFEPDTMAHLLARKKSTPSLRRKRSESSLGASSTTPSDQKPREAKSAPYQDPRYKLLLQTKGSFMDKSDLGITENSKDMYLALLYAEQTVPTKSLFRDDIFERTCRNIQDRNEARVVQDITRLIVPSAETLATYGARELDILIESVNEGWNNSIPLTGTRPQPDYSVGFKREAFTKEQLEKLAPFIGDFIAGDQSFFMATYYMYFPFLTCEVKCGAAALDIADRQNAHSMTLAVRAVVELFRLAGREAEIDREILAFSVSHDHRSVRIYGHYAVIKGKDTTFYRHPIHMFDFTALDGKEKWTAYKLTKSVYDVWMPTHFKRLCSAIDALPQELDFDVAPLPQGSGLSQDLESHHLSQSFAASQTGDDESRSGDTTPNTSFTQGASKRPRRKLAE